MTIMDILTEEERSEIEYGLKEISYLDEFTPFEEEYCVIKRSIYRLEDADCSFYEQQRYLFLLSQGLARVLAAKTKNEMMTFFEEALLERCQFKICLHGLLSAPATHKFAKILIDAHNEKYRSKCKEQLDAAVKYWLYKPLVSNDLELLRSTRFYGNLECHPNQNNHYDIGVTKKLTEANDFLDYYSKATDHPGGILKDTEKTAEILNNINNKCTSEGLASAEFGSDSVSKRLLPMFQISSVYEWEALEEERLEMEKEELIAQLRNLSSENHTLKNLRTLKAALKDTNSSSMDEDVTKMLEIEAALEDTEFFSAANCNAES